MSEETCPDCGQRRWFASMSEHYDPDAHCLKHTGVWHQVAACENRERLLLRKRLSAATARASELERELKALDLLCGSASENGDSVVFSVRDNGQRRCRAKFVSASQGDTAGRAALALAVKLGLIAPDGKGET